MCLSTIIQSKKVSRCVVKIDAVLRIMQNKLRMNVLQLYKSSSESRGCVSGQTEPDEVKRVSCWCLTEAAVQNPGQAVQFLQLQHELGSERRCHGYSSGCAAQPLGGAASLTGVAGRTGRLLPRRATRNPREPIGGEHPSIYNF